MTSNQHHQDLCSALTLNLEDVDFSRVPLKDIQAHVDLRIKQIARGIFFQHLARALNENTEVEGVWIRTVSAMHPINQIQTVEDTDQWEKLRRKPGTQAHSFAQSIKPMLKDMGNYDFKSVILKEFARAGGRRNAFFVSREEILCSWRYLVSKSELGRTADEVKVDTQALRLSEHTAPAPNISRRSPRL